MPGGAPPAGPRRPPLSRSPTPRGVGRPRRPRAGEAARDTRAEALSVVEALLHERGYARMTMDEVARRAGVTKGSLYYHFASKEALVLAFARLVLDRDEAGMRAAIAGAESASGQLLALARWMFARGRQTERVLRDLLRFLPPEHQQAVVQGFMTQLHAHVQRVMEAGSARGELRPHDPAFGAWAFLSLLSEFADVPDLAARPRLAEDLVDLLLRGLGAEGGEQARTGP